MNKEFVTYEQALALKELGFDEPCISYYFSDSIFNDAAEEDDTLHPGDPRFYSDTNTSLSAYTKDELKYNSVSAPLYQQVFRWLRNQYATCWYIQSEYPAFYGLFIHNGTDYDHTVYDTYEEAESACLDVLIEIAKNK